VAVERQSAAAAVRTKKVIRVMIAVSGRDVKRR
jgi:hypothetical protein